MAQRTIHYLFAEMISKEIPLKDKKRFLLGNLLPDAYVNLQDRRKTHFLKRDGSRVCFDFPRFYEIYHTQMSEDDLYLGYYMHLVVDAFYRKLIYEEYQKKPSNMEDVKVLHQDYHLLNHYLVERFEMKNELEEQEVSVDMLSAEIASLDVEKLLADLYQDFCENPDGEMYYMTEEMVEEFVRRYVPLARKEAKAIQSGYSTLNKNDYMWVKGIE